MNEEREGQSKKGKITRGLQITKQVHMQMQSVAVTLAYRLPYISSPKRVVPSNTTDMGLPDSSSLISALARQVKE